MTSINRPPTPQLPPGLGIAIVIVSVLIALASIAQNFWDQKRYENALIAYQSADCDTAIDQFQKIIDQTRFVDWENYVDKATAKVAECEFFMDAVADLQEKQFESALVNYGKVAIYEETALGELVRQDIEKLLEQADPETLATSNGCDRIQTLEDSHLLPKSHEKIPLLYLACGENYFTENRYKPAIVTYQLFIKDYPEHPRLEDAKRGLAKTTVADMKKEEHERDIKPLNKMGTTSDGSTVIEIYNSIPHPMTLTLSGITPKFEELEGCEDCIEYTGKGPETCPEQKTIGLYTLELGQYDVVAQWEAKYPKSIEPGIGTWNLEAGTKYQMCFVTVQYLTEEEDLNIE